MPGLDILYRDEHFIVVNKPAGLFVHKSELDRRADYALHYVRDMAGCYVWPVHRLDRPTSGILVFACSRDAAGALSHEFSERRVEKTYLAVVRGYTLAEGVIDHPIASDKDSPSKHAVTAYTRLMTTELPYPVGPYDSARYSLVEVRPHTGRNHQIRRHFDHLFHPLIGDRVYGDGRHNRFIREHFGIERLLLAATSLFFTHPMTGHAICLNAPLALDMDHLIREMFV
ncbi:MAG: hypothetical protein KKD44_23180 [Proteobacteria bacterium]|nr:hypothetical protein [Pseudomonadota bacterium]